MSLTLPYASAVNCKFVALPDSLATDDNTLKLYNIDGGGGGGTTDAYTKAQSDARFLRLAAPSQTISQIPNSAGIRMNSGAFLDWFFGATGTSQPFRFKTANGGIVNFYVSSPVDGDSRNIFIPQISTGNVFFLVDRPTNPQTIYKSTLNLDYTGGTASSSAMLIKGYGSGLGNGLDFLASTQTSGTRHIRFFAAPAALRGEVYDNGSGMCYQGNEANVNKLTLNGNSVTDIVTTVTGVSDSKVPSEWAVKRYVDANGSGNAVLKTGAQTMEGPLTVPQLNTTKIVLNGNTNIMNFAPSGGTAKDLWVPAILNDYAAFIISDPTGPQIIRRDLAVEGNVKPYRLHFSSTPSIELDSATNDITAAQETTQNIVPSSYAVCNWVKKYVVSSNPALTWLPYSYYNDTSSPPAQVTAPTDTFTKSGINTFYVKAFASSNNTTTTIATFALSSGTSMGFRMTISGVAHVTTANTMYPFQMTQTMFKNSNNTGITITDNTSPAFTDVTGLQAVPKFVVSGTNVLLQLIKSMNYYSWINMKVEVNVLNFA